MQWTLIKETQDGSYNKFRKCNETVMHYQSGDQIVAFHPHPTKAWNYVLVSGDRKLAGKVISALIEAGLDQHKFKGGFAEAVKTLTTS